MFCTPNYLGLINSLSVFKALEGPEKLDANAAISNK